MAPIRVDKPAGLTPRRSCEDIRDGARRSQWDNAGNPWRAGAFRQLQQRHGAEDDSNLLNAAAQQLGKLF